MLASDCASAAIVVRFEFARLSMLNENGLHSFLTSLALRQLAQMSKEPHGLKRRTAERAKVALVKQHHTKRHTQLGRLTRVPNISALMHTVGAVLQNSRFDCVSTFATMPRTVADLVASEPCVSGSASALHCCFTGAVGVHDQHEVDAVSVGLEK
jgi:hypothetical protein